MRASLLLLLLIGCGDPVVFYGYEPDTGLSSGCPSGYAEASSAEAGFTTFLLDGLAVSVQLDTSAGDDDGPATCVGDAGTSAIMRLVSAGEPYATLTYTSTEAGTFGLSELPGSMKLDVFGGDAVNAFGATDWTVGSFTVFSVGSSFEFGFNGEGNHDNTPLVLSFSATVEP